MWVVYFCKFWVFYFGREYRGFVYFVVVLIVDFICLLCDGVFSVLVKCIGVKCFLRMVVSLGVGGGLFLFIRFLVFGWLLRFFLVFSVFRGFGDLVFRLYNSFKFFSFFGVIYIELIYRYLLSFNCIRNIVLSKEVV